MAHYVCDREPCEYMRMAIDALVTYSYTPTRFSIMVRCQVDPRLYFLMPLKYCPFCGTRIDPQWVKNFYDIPVEEADRVTG